MFLFKNILACDLKTINTNKNFLRIQLRNFKTSCFNKKYVDTIDKALFESVNAQRAISIIQLL